MKSGATDHASATRRMPLSERGVVRLGGILEPKHNNFGLIRLGLALAVLVSHAFYLRTGDAQTEPLTSLTGHSLGEHAVQIFFFLSGLMVAQSFDRSGSLVNFFSGRVLRIFPGLLVCVLLTACVLGPLVSTLDAASYFTAPEFRDYILKTISLTTGLAPLPGVFTSVPAAGVVNMSLWTLKYEVFCYLALAVAGLAGLFAPKRKPWAATLLALFIFVIFLKSPNGQVPYTATDNIRYFALFFATGVLAYIMRDLVLLHGAIAAALAICFWLALGTRFTELASALFLGYTALLAGSWPLGALRHWSNRVDLSYGVYIYACPVQQLIVERMPDLPLSLQALASIAAVLVLAYASWTLVERPALSWRAAVSTRFATVKNT